MTPTNRDLRREKRMENKTVSVGRWQYSEPAFEADENGHIVICSKSSVAPAEFFEWGIDAEKRPF